MRGQVWSLVIVLSAGAFMQRTAEGQQPVAPVQQPAVSASADRAQQEKYVSIMKSELEKSEARVGAVTAQLVSLDEDIESRINRVVSLLSGVRDSSESSSARLRKTKEDVLDGLKAVAVYYAQQRDARKKEIGNRNARADDAELARDVAALNARIEARVTQSLDIASSLAQYSEPAVEKHSERNTYYQDRITDYRDTTPEYKREQRETREAAKIKSEIGADLRASIEKQTREIKGREAELAAATDPKKKEQLTKDIEDARKIIAARKDQLEKLVATSGPSTRALSNSGAFELDKTLDEMIQELKKDFSKFKSLVYELDAARARVKPLKERLEKATAALDAMPVKDEQAAGSTGAKDAGK